MSETTLRPCPFCQELENVNTFRAGADIYVTKCSGCFVVGPAASTSEGATEVWNRRPAEDALMAALEEVREAFKTITRQGVESWEPDELTNWLADCSAPLDALIAKHGKEQG